MTRAMMIAFAVVVAVGGCGDSDADVGQAGGEGSDPEGEGVTAEECANSPMCFDCAVAPSVSVVALTGPKASRTVAFDDEGKLITDYSSDDPLRRYSYGGDFETFGPEDLLDARGAVVLPNGEIVADSNRTYTEPGPPPGEPGLPAGEYVVNELVRIDGNASTFLYTYPQTWQMTLGPNQQVYGAEHSGNVVRVDPLTGETEDIVPHWQFEIGTDSPSFGWPIGLEFSPDLSRLYISHTRRDAQIFVVDLDADGTPTDVAKPLVASTPEESEQFDYPFNGWGAYQLQADACGYLYAWVDETLYRISPSGSELTELVTLEGAEVESSRFGRGIGGWKIDALYVSQPDDDGLLSEVNLGVPSREWDGIVINAPRQE